MIFCLFLFDFDFNKPILCFFISGYAVIDRTSDFCFLLLLIILYLSFVSQQGVVKISSAERVPSNNEMKFN